MEISVQKTLPCGQEAFLQDADGIADDRIGFQSGDSICQCRMRVISTSCRQLSSMMIEANCTAARKVDLS
ncbi:hypothetical protein LOC54_11540, partial [Acetobacter sp. AN02]|nr:hypothetical protein [Acetobacter sp. AN02]